MEPCKIINMKKKVVHITTVHNALDARIFFRECRSLAGHHHTFLIAPGAADFNLNDVQVLALGKQRGRLYRATVLQIKALLKARSLKADVYHFHDPELILTGLILKLFGFRVVYDVHEDVPKDILLKSHIPAFLRRPISSIAGFVEKLAAKYCDAIVTVTPDIAGRFPADKTFMVKNYPYAINEPFSFEHYVKRQTDMIYIGSISLNRGLLEMVSAAEKTQKKLQLIGNAPQELIDNNISSQTHVEYIPWIPSSELSSRMAQSKIGLVLLHPTATFMTSYPLKLFEYMASGIPVIASNFPEWAKIIDKYRCGLLVDPMNPDAVNEAISDLLNHPEKAYQMGQNGLNAISTELNWDRELEVLLSVYEFIWAGRSQFVRQN